MPAVTAVFNITPETPIDLLNALPALRVQLIEAALHEAHGNNSKAAEMLGLKRTTFLEMRRRHSFPINPPGKRRA